MEWGEEDRGACDHRAEMHIAPNHIFCTSPVSLVKSVSANVF